MTEEERKEDPENTKMENGKTRGSEEVCIVQLANNDASRNQLTRSARPSGAGKTGPRCDMTNASVGGK